MRISDYDDGTITQRETLHRTGGTSKKASFIGGEMIRRRVKGIVEVEERVTDGVTERVTDGTETVVPDGAFVVRDVGIDGGAS